MKTLIQELADITPQRPLSEVAKECDIIFSDGPLEIKSTIVTDPFRAALDYTRQEKKKSMAVFDKYFTCVWPDATWMRSLRLYQEMERLE